MKKKIVSLLMVSAIGVSALAGCGSQTASTNSAPESAAEAVSEAASVAEATDVAKDADQITGTYSIQVDSYDWGPAVSRAVVSLSEAVDSVTPETFKVTETKQTTDFTDQTFPVIETTLDRTVTGAFLSDAEGNPVEGASKYVTLDMFVSPNDGSPFLYEFSNQRNLWSNPYYLTISLADGQSLTSDGNAVSALSVDTAYSQRNSAADVFSYDSFTAGDEVTYNYAYKTKEGSDTLVVWLHGLGEGGTEGTDPSISALGSKVLALLGDEFQNEIGGASVLVPQCPTYWMDSDGKSSNFTGGAIQADGTSYYTASLKELIDQYAADCGATKIVLAGCSNGGYMTMLLAMEDPAKYAAVVPICEAVPDQTITDEQIASLVNTPLYFIYAENDTTVDPSLHEAPTIERLRNAGATNLHVSTTPNVVDQTGEIKDADGNPYEYMGHFSWVHFFNNDTADADGTSAWTWIAGQVKE